MSNVSSFDTSAANNNSSAPNGFPEGMAPSTVNDSAREVMAAIARWYQDTDGSLATGGTGNTYTLTSNSTHTALGDQSFLVFRVDRANTGAATLNVDSLGAKSLNVNGSELLSGDLVKDVIVMVVYNSTSDTYDIIGGILSLSDDSVSTAKIQDDAVTYAKVQDISATDRLLGRDTAGSGVIEEISVSGGVQFNGSGSVILDTSSNRNVDHSSVNITAGTALTGGGNLTATRTLNLDISSLTSMTVAPAGADTFLYNDGGTMKQMSFNQAATFSNTDSGDHTFVDGDVGGIRYYTGTGGNTWTMNTGVGQNDCYIMVINSGTGNLTIASGTATVRTAVGLTIEQDGVGVLIREADGTWFLGGTGLN